MKRFCLVSSLICTITLIVTMSIFLILAIVDNNKNKPEFSLVYIESIKDENIKNGMGFVYKEENNVSFIVTNYHVIDSSDQIYINDNIKADIVDYDKYTDIAILKVNKKFKPAKIGKHTLKENDYLFYFNINKQKLEKTNVLSLNNEININTNYGNSSYNAVAIYGDIQEGNSGSPIYNNNKAVIGLLSLKDETNEISFYLPVEFVMGIVKKLENHELYRPNLGALFINTSNIEKLNEYSINTHGVNGIVILDVKAEYPLSSSGLINGDIITKINDKVILDVNDFQKEIYSFNKNDSISIEYFREGMQGTTNIVLNK